MLFDPDGGKNLAALTPLEKHDPWLVSGRVWTEERHIADHLQRLRELISEIQRKYLQAKHSTIEGYNTDAKIPQPYHVLVITGFPARFTTQAVKQLEEIVRGGPACGVYTIVGQDISQALPRDCDASMREIEHLSTVVAVGKDGAFRFASDKDKVFEGWTLTLTEPPPQEVFEPVLIRIAQEAKAGRVVEVPATEIASPVWLPEATTDDGIEVPIGLEADDKRLLRLSSETNVHALIVGQVRSGKSNLLNAIIMAMAIKYHPRELDLYLIDFKHGVGFNTYAAEETRLPHARVVAVRTEREYGYSVLTAIHKEIVERSDAFKSVGVDTLANYNKARPEQRMARICLIVDEFQELFSAESSDRLTGQVSALLDNVVRQGGAYGVHVLLASQSLGGAQRAAQTTIDNMVVRIALQVSETDGAAILSRDNDAARLLHRAGEGVYNDASGHERGNHFFQTAWVDPDWRARSLRALRERAKDERLADRIHVFDADVAPSVQTSEPLKGKLVGAVPTERQRGTTLWLGEPVGIEQLTAVSLRRQTGHNLLVLGVEEATALGVLSAALVSAAAQSRADSDLPTIGVVDATLQESEHEDALDRLRTALPHRLLYLGPDDHRELPVLLRQLADSLADRRAEHQAGRPPIFLFIHGLMRLPVLRPGRTAGSLGTAARPTFFSSTPSGAAADAPSAAEAFRLILRDGPEVGIHTVATCDTLPNLRRVLEGGWDELFALRVGLQMDEETSGTFLNSRAAARLGLARAILFDDHRSTSETFRPFAIPPVDWVDGLRSMLDAKAIAGSM